MKWVAVFPVCNVPRVVKRLSPVFALSWTRVVFDLAKSKRRNFFLGMPENCLQQYLSLGQFFVETTVN